MGWKHSNPAKRGHYGQPRDTSLKEEMGGEPEGRETESGGEQEERERMT